MRANIILLSLLLIPELLLVITLLYSIQYFKRDILTWLVIFIVMLFPIPYVVVRINEQANQ